MKKIIMASLLAIGISAPLLAQAGSLTLHNYTKKDSTALVNGACSTMLGEKGVTRAGQTNTLTEKQVNQACAGGDKTHCQALVFMTDHCNVGNPSEPVIAEIYLNTSTGITSSETKDPSYNLTVNNPFEVTLTGGPQ